jgi:predicted nuclease with TOPRIM domain
LYSQDLNNLNAKYQEKISQFNQLTGENKRLKSKMTDLESQLNNIIGENKTINLDYEKLKGQHKQ